MIIQLRLAFRPDELISCAGIEALRPHLRKNSTRPFWFDSDESTVKEIRRHAPRVIDSAHLARLVLRGAESKRVQFFELTPQLLIPVSDADFEAWDQMHANFPVRLSPDGHRTRFPHRLPLSQARLAENQIGCPESGESCFVTNRLTIATLRAAGVKNMRAEQVVSVRSSEVVALQAEKILSASEFQMAFGIKEDECGCRVLDRPAVMAINASDASEDFDIALLPESRDSCSGTVVVGQRFKGACEKIGVRGVKFSPVLVIGDALWRDAYAMWDEVMST